VYEVIYMQIESRNSDMARELPSKGGVGGVVSRQRSGTSDPSGGAPKAPKPQQKPVLGSVGNTSAKKPSPDPIDLKVTVDKLNKVFQDQQRDVAFSVDEEANTTVIKFFNKNTGELIKQYPPEEVLAMKAKLRKQTGWLVDKKA
jgi:flagellar protein FlaG